jgi:CRISPR-associated endoribonuclease Cas6
MRFYLEIELEKNELPLEFRRVILSMIKSSLSSAAEGRFYNRYYEGNTPIKKDFTFSVYMKGAIFTKEKIQLSERTFKVYFTADDKNKTGLILMNAFLIKKGNKFPLENNNNLKIKNVIQINQDLIFNSEVTVRTFAGSSIVAREHNRENNKDRYFTIEDNGYNEKLTDVIRVQARLAGYCEDDVLNINIKALEDCKKVLVRHYGCFIDCTIGSFLIRANPDILQYLYDAGAGSRSNSGFGMLNLISQ